MKDRHGKPLAVGDVVHFSATVKEIGPTGDKSQVMLESVYGRSHDGQVANVLSIDSSVLEKATPTPQEKKAVKTRHPADAGEEGEK